jgi:peptidoglycan/LPS O-acetylase OafA/YrhL
MDAKAANNPSSEARRGEQRRSRYSTQVAGVLVAAFTISVLYSVISTLSGVTHEANNLEDPSLWIFYVVGFGLAALARMDRTESWWMVSVAVLLLLLGGIFLYPAYFVPSTQTAFGWFENDVYIGLLILAEYLCIQRLRNVTLTPGR